MDSSPPWHFDGEFRKQDASSHNLKRGAAAVRNDGRAGLIL